MERFAVFSQPQWTADFLAWNKTAPFAMLGNMLYFPLSLHHKFIKAVSILNYCERKAVGCI